MPILRSRSYGTLLKNAHGENRPRGINKNGTRRTHYTQTKSCKYFGDFIGVNDVRTSVYTIDKIYSTLCHPRVTFYERDRRVYVLFLSRQFFFFSPVNNLDVIDTNPVRQSFSRVWRASSIIHQYLLSYERTRGGVSLRIRRFHTDFQRNLFAGTCFCKHPVYGTCTTRVYRSRGNRRERRWRHGPRWRQYARRRSYRAERV